MPPRERGDGRRYRSEGAARGRKAERRPPSPGARPGPSRPNDRGPGRPAVPGAPRPAAPGTQGLPKPVKRFRPKPGAPGAADYRAGADRGSGRGGKKDPSRPSAPISENRRFGFAGGRRPYDYAAYEKEPATPGYLRRCLARHGFGVTDGQLSKFWRFYELLRRYNAELDLTRIMGLEATALKHFVDSAHPLRFLALEGPVLDIGTGPGFPGAPMAIMRPDLRFVLAESRGKRVTFLEELVRELRLENVRLWPRSVREDSPFAGGWAVRDVVTRALETIPPTLERVRPFVPRGGLVALWKGPNCDDEIVRARSAFPDDFRLRDDIQYLLPASDQPRRLVVYERL